MGFGERDLGEVARRGAGGRVDHRQCMVGPDDQRVGMIDFERDSAGFIGPFAGHRDGAEGGAVDRDRQPLGGGDEDVAAIGLAAQHGREHADHRVAADRLAAIGPAAIAVNDHLAVAAMRGVPPFDWRQGAAGERLRQRVE